MRSFLLILTAAFAIASCQPPSSSTSDGGHEEDGADASFDASLKDASFDAMVTDNDSNVTCTSCLCTDGTNVWAEENCSFVSSSSLGSNSNLIITSPSNGVPCNAITTLTVTINVLSDIISSDGFAFQLNTYSANIPDAGANYPTYQQYGIAFYENENNLFGYVDNWAASGETINETIVLSTLDKNYLPAGYSMTMVLSNDDSGNVSSVSFSGSNNGIPFVPQSIDLTSVIDAPIVAATVDLIDSAGGYDTVFYSGSGIMVYSSDEQLSAGTSIPSCAATGWSISGETGNSIYGPMPSKPGHNLAQSFFIEL
jgi:hypothetical protein